MHVHVIVNEGGVVGVDLFGFAAVAVDGAPHAAAKADAAGADADDDAHDGQHANRRGYQGREN